MCSPRVTRSRLLDWQSSSSALPPKLPPNCYSFKGALSLFAIKGILFARDQERATQHFNIIISLSTYDNMNNTVIDVLYLVTKVQEAFDKIQLRTSKTEGNDKLIKHFQLFLCSTKSRSCEMMMKMCLPNRTDAFLLPLPARVITPCLSSARRAFTGGRRFKRIMLRTYAQRRCRYSLRSGTFFL